ncbi:hypothetical protein FIU91_03535 [Roseivivax sp. THAF30]|nr:hypothetical protein FIU91_03535 [Roseivivax sp. THAF30]
MHGNRNVVSECAVGSIFASMAMTIMGGFAFDSVPAKAATSRRRIFDMDSKDKMLVAGSHVYSQGFGRILTDGWACRYIPATWM